MKIKHAKYGFEAEVVSIEKGTVVFDTPNGRDCCNLDEFEVIEDG